MTSFSFHGNFGFVETLQFTYWIVIHLIMPNCLVYGQPCNIQVSSLYPEYIIHAKNKKLISLNKLLYIYFLTVIRTGSSIVKTRVFETDKKREGKT